jgi:hypothetical protein
MGVGAMHTPLKRGVNESGFGFRAPHGVEMNGISAIPLGSINSSALTGGLRPPATVWRPFGMRTPLKRGVNENGFSPLRDASRSDVGEAAGGVAEAFQFLDAEAVGHAEE